MASSKLKPHDLLDYNSRYGVLICRECEYAVQKSAVPSHLLRHKIYRAKRQQLLASFADFHLCEPEDVPLPHPSSAPIATLPVISGYRCTAAGCGNLCVSTKRMRRHWSEVHGCSDSIPDSFARPAKLQTFFRGTKLRYFEVESTSLDEEQVQPQPVAFGIDGQDDQCASFERNGRFAINELIAKDQPTLYHHVAVPNLPTPSLNLPWRAPASADLETLTYFHHFITLTSLTLPGLASEAEAADHWQKFVVPQALRRPWLMSGLLAISACHLGVFTHDIPAKRSYCQRVAQFFSDFATGLDEAVNNDCETSSTGHEAQVRQAGKQLRFLLGAGQAVLADTLDPEHSTGPVSTPELQLFIDIVKTFVAHDWTPRACDLCNPCANQNMGALYQTGSRVLEKIMASGTRSHNRIPPMIFERLRALPSNMAEALGRPESTCDVQIVLSAIAALIECCEISFSSHEPVKGWRGMALWLAKVPDHFHHMIPRRDPAALVVLAYWAAFLVKRTELCGSWFLRGSAKTLLVQIAEAMPPDNFVALDLIRELTA
jgi:hypothetical protein